MAVFSEDFSLHVNNKVKTIEEYVADKVQSWVSEVSALAGIANSRPHATYSAFTHGLIGRWVYLMRTVPDISSFFKTTRGCHTIATSSSSFWTPWLLC